MNMLTNDNNIEILDKKISLLVNDMSGYDYLSHCVRAITSVLNFSSCCIYKIEEHNDLNDCHPLYISSADHYKLITEVNQGSF